MSDQREDDMLALMRDCQQMLRRMETKLNEMWAEWTRLHEPTIDRSGPKPKASVFDGRGNVKSVKRVLR